MVQRITYMENVCMCVQERRKEMAHKNIYRSERRGALARMIFFKTYQILFFMCLDGNYVRIKMN